MPVSISWSKGMITLDSAVRATFACNIFLACTSFAIVMPSLWPYLQSMGGNRAFLAWVVASYSVGEALGAIGFGWAFERYDSRPLLLNCIGLAVVGSALYAAAEVMSTEMNLCAMLIARVVQGIGSGGQQAVEQAFIGERVAPIFRTQVTSMLSSWATFGFLVGPVVGVPLTFLDVTFMGYRVNSYTSPAILICVCYAIMLIITWVYFRPSSKTDLFNSITHSTNPSMHLLMYPDPEANDDPSNPLLLSGPNTLGIFTCMFIFFVHFAGFAIIETICTPLIEHVFNWGTRASFELFSISGGMSVVTLLCLGALSEHFEDYNLLLMSLIIGLLGYSLMIPDLFMYHGTTRYCTGFILISIAFPYGRALSLSILSKLLGSSPDQALYLGIVFAVGAIARTLGPFIAVAINPIVLFSLASAIFLIAIIVQLSAWDVLRATEDQQGSFDKPIVPTPKMLRRTSFGRQGSVTVIPT